MISGWQAVENSMRIQTVWRKLKSAKKQWKCNVERWLTGKLLEKWCTRILDEKSYITAHMYSSAAKWYPWWRKTLTRLNDFWKDSTVPKRTSSAANNYRPIPSLHLLWELMTGVSAEKIYSHLDRDNVLPSEQKRCRKGSRRIKDHLLTDKTMLRNCKRRHTNLVTLIMDKKPDTVPHSWISECFEIFGTPNNVQDFLNNCMKSWKLELNTPGEQLGKVDISRGIFQRNSLSPLLFVLCMVP